MNREQLQDCRNDPNPDRRNKAMWGNCERVTLKSDVVYKGDTAYVVVEKETGKFDIAYLADIKPLPAPTPPEPEKPMVVAVYIAKGDLYALERGRSVNYTLYPKGNPFFNGDCAVEKARHLIYPGCMDAGVLIVKHQIYIYPFMDTHLYVCKWNHGALGEDGAFSLEHPSRLFPRSPEGYAQALLAASRAALNTK